MVQKEVSLGCVLAWVGWVLVLLTATAGLWFHINTAGFAVLFGGAAAVLHVRGFFRALEHREQTAFQLGRDSVRSVK